MDSIISVVVTAYSDCKYIVRCLNSIRRQTYKNVEIIVVMKEEMDAAIQENRVKVVRIVGEDKYTAISNAINMAVGDYVFFCSSDSIMTENTFEALISAENGNIICPCIKVYTPAGADYTWNKMSNISIYGKLFRREIIRKRIDEATQKCWFDEFNIVMAYLGQCEDIVEISNAIIYEAKEKNLTECIVSAEQSNDYWKKILQRAAGYDAKIRNYVTSGIGEVIAESQDNTEEVMYFAEEILHDDVWLNYVLANRLIKKWWDIICHGENQSVYENFKTYLMKFEHDVLLEMLLTECKLNTSLYEVLKNNNQQIFLQVMGKIKQAGKPAIQSGAINVVIQEKQDDLSGVVLAEYVINKFRDGKLGLKTIIKSFTAWIKFKI